MTSEKIYKNYRLPALQISYNGFCALGGLKNPFCFTKAVYLGSHYIHTEYYYAAEVINNHFKNED